MADGYREKVDRGDWPPTNREAIMFVIGLLIGGFIVAMLWMVS